METTYLYINTKDALLCIDIDKIAYMETYGNYTTIVLVNKRKYSLYMSLLKAEQALCDALKGKKSPFQHISKQHVINMAYLYEINTQKQLLTLSDYRFFEFVLQVPKDALLRLRQQLIEQAKPAEGSS